MKAFSDKKIWQKNNKRQAGMTYVEVIVVLSIFSALTSVIMFNYGDFQERVDIKNLASDVALKIVEAQKSSLSGVLPPAGFIPIAGWKPSYGVYFAAASDKSFIHFVDLNSDTFFNGTDCTGECMNKTTITKGNYISRLDVFYESNPTVPVAVPYLVFAFTRPNSGAAITANGSPVLDPDILYAQITVSSPKGALAYIKINPSGRIEID